MVRKRIRTIDSELYPNVCMLTIRMRFGDMVHFYRNLKFRVLIGISKEVEFIDQIFTTRNEIHQNANMNEGSTLIIQQNNLESLSKAFIDYLYGNYLWWINQISYLPNMDTIKFLPINLDRDYFTIIHEYMY